MGTNLLDTELVKRVQKGDKTAFDLLVLKYQHKVVNLVSRFVSDQAECQDIAQDAFIKAYRAIGNFRGDSQFYTWLYRIAANTAKNYLASRARKSPTYSVDVDDAEHLATVDQWRAHRAAHARCSYAFRMGEALVDEGVG